MRTLAILAAVAALGAAGPALAHARLLHAAPKVGETVHASPSALRLFFSESIDLRKSSVALAGPTGPVTTGPIAVDAEDPRVVIVPLRVRLGPGAYHVSWSMISMDTHHTEGDFIFKVAP